MRSKIEKMRNLGPREICLDESLICMVQQDNYTENINVPKFHLSWENNSCIKPRIHPLFPVFIITATIPRRDHKLSVGNPQYLGRDVSFPSFDYQVMRSIMKETPDVIFVFVTSPVS